MARAVPKSLRNHRDPLFDLVEEGLCLSSTRSNKVVELGSHCGWWAYRCLRQLPQATVYCVDLWNGPKVWQAWRRNLRQWFPERVIPLRMRTSEASELFPESSLDLVFVDADHHEASVYEDLSLWWPKVAPGGILAGHDWEGKWGPQVRAAVRRLWPDRSTYCVDRLYQSQKHLGLCYWRQKQ